MLCERYGVVVRTIDRWTAAGILPEPMVINGYRYWDEAEVEERDRQNPHRGRAATKSKAGQLAEATA